MDAKKLYLKLESDFIFEGLSDEWAEWMSSVSDYLSDNFKTRSMGLVCDNAQKINRVYTGVFPSKKVMEKIISDDAYDAMLFVHHPAIWDIRTAPKIFHQMDRSLLEEFKKRRISIYNLHVPLDNFGKYSTSATLANALGLTPTTPFAPYFGGLCGVVCTTNNESVSDLSNKFTSVLGHTTVWYNYGANKIKDGRVAVVAGGGNEIETLKELVEYGINTFITGITSLNDHSAFAHDFAKKHKINLLGGTHYSTEKFACIAMCDYFKQLGISSEFLKDEPLMEDL